jgi:hypothetical protein
MPDKILWVQFSLNPSLETRSKQSLDRTFAGTIATGINRLGKSGTGIAIALLEEKDCRVILWVFM